MRIMIKIAYDGTTFNGWQSQPIKNTIQDNIQAALKRLTGEDIIIHGSGRTDAGVHALAQTAHFDLEKNLEVENIVNGLNFYLPESIRVLSAKRVSNSFHARKSCKRKTYIYKCYYGSVDNPLEKNRAFLLKNRLDLNDINEKCELFVGTHDFRAFCSSGGGQKTSERTIYSLRARNSNGYVIFEITANGFLYNMVRKIVAGILHYNKKDLVELIDNGVEPIKHIMPPYGLYLKRVSYAK